jgi:hypothetical protein
MSFFLRSSSMIVHQRVACFNLFVQFFLLLYQYMAGSGCCRPLQKKNDGTAAAAQIILFKFLERFLKDSLAFLFLHSRN